MKKFLVRKIFPYDPTFSGKYSKFDGYGQITSRRKDPEISELIAVGVSQNIDEPIFCSTLKRGRQTASVFAEKCKIKKITKIRELDEIAFDLERLVSESEYEKFGSDLVRQRFIEFFITDNLGEKRNSIEKRIKSLLSKLNKLPDGNYLLVSHSFFMKILQIYLKNRRLFRNPGILAKKFDFKKKTFDFGKGFDFSF